MENVEDVASAVRDHLEKIGQGTRDIPKLH
jgi:hypothetical protein